ncbi:MAG: type II toxin-antitoxin system RelE/ParE family toxin [Clostridiales Family XIII bacterium]|nr:type II toxin-antitoxin system RelE/ParE family toxin [Clostridiales Family XIII bacterium]
MEYRINIAQNAQGDIRKNVDYIRSELKNPSAAKNLLTETRMKVQSLKQHPKRCPLVGDKHLALVGFRMIAVKKYYLFYIIYDEKSEVRIIRQLHSRQDWRTILGAEFSESGYLNEDEEILYNMK